MLHPRTACTCLPQEQGLVCLQAWGWGTTGLEQQGDSDVPVLLKGFPPTLAVTAASSAHQHFLAILDRASTPSFLHTFETHGCQQQQKIACDSPIRAATCCKVTSIPAAELHALPAACRMYVQA